MKKNQITTTLAALSAVIVWAAALCPTLVLRI
jgi:hypothetical protein